MLSLVLLSSVMALVTLAAGWVPLLFPQKLDTSLLSQFGTGVILGSAFLLVIPEAYEQIGSGRLSWIAGVAVVGGFLLMLAIDFALAQSTRDTDPEGLHTQEEDAELMVTRPKRITFGDVSSWWSGISFTTLGLTVHAAADGIALGSTAGNENSKLELMVFLSIIIHKAPAALSLTSILLAHKSPPTHAQVKRDLILFSLAGPVIAILLGGAISLMNISGGMGYFSGVCLALSGGTFLFVATHVLEHARVTDNVWRPFALIASGTVCPLIASMIPE